MKQMVMQRYQNKKTNKQSRGKRLLSLCLALFIFMSLTGCVGGDTGTEDKEASRNLSNCIISLPATSFNIELAKIAAELSEVSEKVSDTEIRKCYSKYGIKHCDTENYGTWFFGGGAYCLGIKTIEEDGENIALVVITARGSTTKAEYIGDQRWFAEVAEWRKEDFYTYRVWDNVKDFEEGIWNKLSSYMVLSSKYKYIPKGYKVKFLVTGHSLGGAAASLLGARIKEEMLDNPSVSGKITKDDVYVYTFNAITVLTSSDNVSSGYENIHNVYNKYDSFGPNGNQKKWNASSPYAKFGHTEMYEKQEEENGDSAYGHCNYRYALDHPDECKLVTCTGVGRIQLMNKVLKPDFPEIASIDDYNAANPDENVESYSSDEENYDSETLHDGDHLDWYSSSVPEGSYLSTDGFNQVFTFYGDNRVTMSAFGIESDGIYTIKNGRIYISYDLFGGNVWNPTFSMDGTSIYIAGTEFVWMGD